MTPLPPDPTPTEVHVRLLTLMGWTIITPETLSANQRIHDPIWYRDPSSNLPYAERDLPSLDDNLLRLARERLLTTHELWEAYLWEVCAQLGVSIAIMWSIVGYQTIMDSPILTHAIAICRAVEKGEA